MKKTESKFLTSTSEETSAHQFTEQLVNLCIQTLNALPKEQLNDVIHNVELSKVDWLYEGDLTKPETLAYLLVCSVCRHYSGDTKYLNLSKLSDDSANAKNSTQHLSNKLIEQYDKGCIDSIIRLFSPLETFIKLLQADKYMAENQYLNFFVQRWLTRNFLNEFEAIKQSSRIQSSRKSTFDESTIKWPFH